MAYTGRRRRHKAGSAKDKKQKKVAVQKHTCDPNKCRHSNDKRCPLNLHQSGGRLGAKQMAVRVDTLRCAGC